MPGALGLCWIVGLLAGTFVPPPVAARTRPAGLDVERIDAFVREQVRRHGMPGLALALVDGEQIVHLQGYGKADQTGRKVTPQTPFVRPPRASRFPRYPTSVCQWSPEESTRNSSNLNRKR